MTIIKLFHGEQQIPLLVIFGPSGAGKSTLIQKLLDDPERGSFFSRSVSLTTRDKREGEQEGIHYHFVTDEEMVALKTSGMLLESSVVYGNHYATLKANIAKIMSEKKVAVMDLSMEAIKNVEKLGLMTKFVFITAGHEELKKRLRGRQTEDDLSLKLRICAARTQIEFGETSDLFEKNIVNSDLENAYMELVNFLESEFKTVKKLI